LYFYSRIALILFQICKFYMLLIFIKKLLIFPLLFLIFSIVRKRKISQKELLIGFAIILIMGVGINLIIRGFYTNILVELLGVTLGYILCVLYIKLAERKN
jgi:hypothetical protein